MTEQRPDMNAAYWVATGFAGAFARVLSYEGRVRDERDAEEPRVTVAFADELVVVITVTDAPPRWRIDPSPRFLVEVLDRDGISVTSQTAARPDRLASVIARALKFDVPPTRAPKLAAVLSQLTARSEEASPVTKAQERLDEEHPLDRDDNIVQQD